jgi:hypothetical protein
MFRVAVRVRLTVLALLALGAALLTAISAAASSPALLSTAASRGHVVAVFTFEPSESPDMAPKHIAVATRTTTRLNGSFVPANVRVQEPITTFTRTANGMRVRTQHKLRPGRYYVKVSGVVIGLDCTPKFPCKELWSNARRVVIPRP